MATNLGFLFVLLLIFFGGPYSTVEFAVVLEHASTIAIATVDPGTVSSLSSSIILNLSLHSSSSLELMSTSGSCSVSFVLSLFSAILLHTSVIHDKILLITWQF